jgi:hypothetical protein
LRKPHCDRFKFSGITSLGEKLKVKGRGKPPEQQRAIVQGLAAVAAKIREVWEAVKQFLASLLETLKDVVNFFVEKWHEVKDWFQRTFNL